MIEPATIITALLLLSDEIIVLLFMGFGLKLTPLGSFVMLIIFGCIVTFGLLTHWKMTIVGLVALVLITKGATYL